jgi:aminoglycoside 6-adenylyltransferase
MPADYDQLEARFADWIARRDDIRLAVVVGSRARQDRTNDQWGDLDTVIWTTTPEAYADAGWLADFGDVWAAYRQYIRPGTAEWLAVLAGGLDFDMAIVPAQAPLTAEQVIAAQMDQVFARGVRVLLDRDGVWGQWSPPNIINHPLPDEAELTQAVNQFWRYAGRAARKLRRGELWVATQLINGLLQQAVRMLAEWHTLAADRSAEVWYEGHFLEEWADARVVAALRGTLAPYQADGAWSALIVVCELFRWLSAETTARLGYTAPAVAADEILHDIRMLAPDRSPD